MTRLTLYSIIATLMMFGGALWAQENDTSVESASSVHATEFDPTDINGTWITQSGNLVEVTLEGTEVRLYFPVYARTMSATFDGTTLIYITHYNDPSKEECYVDAPESDRDACERFIQRDDPRHRFTLTLSPDGMVLAGSKEINVLHFEWDTDENGNTSNHRPAGYVWEYFGDYQWRRADCSFSNLPPVDGNAVTKYELIAALFDRFGIREEFALQDFEIRDRVRFEYTQAYIDADNGAFVSAAETSQHPHIEPLDGRVRLDDATGVYKIDLYPYSFRSYVSLLAGLTILCHQVQSLESSDSGLAGPTTQMELDSVNYAWSHRQGLCSTEDELFDHHIDFLSRALQFRMMEEE